MVWWHLVLLLPICLVYVLIELVILLELEDVVLYFVIASLSKLVNLVVEKIACND